ncbi:MAG TPA: hypothetical protein VJR94_00030 [Candidatus Nitrosocosmicus sp.]|nr:hypothetical protein [Candidatus Nitrosocosmicus sp.]
MALRFIAGSLAINAYAQNMSQSANQTGESAQGAVKETGEASGNATEGMGAALNETGEALSNVTGGIMEGPKTSLMAQVKIQSKLSRR